THEWTNADVLARGPRRGMGVSPSEEDRQAWHGRPAHGEGSSGVAWASRPWRRIVRRGMGVPPMEKDRSLASTCFHGRDVRATKGRCHQSQMLWSSMTPQRGTAVLETFGGTVMLRSSSPLCAYFR